MIKKIALFFVLISTIFTFGQKVNFPDWGQFSDYEKNLKVYKKDSTANAVVLNEIGFSYVKNSGEYEIIKKYYTRIKILNTEGFKHATVEIPTFKEEKVKEIKVSTTNFINGKEIVFLNESKIYKTNVSEFWHQISFTLPNIKSGSIIEYSFETHTPYHHTFANGWLFQSEIPKSRKIFLPDNVDS